MKALLRVCALLCALNLNVQSLAQNAAEKAAGVSSAGLDSGAKVMIEAAQLRTVMAAAVANQTEKPDLAIGRLRAASSASGLNIDRDADFAYAAIDVGQRLIAADKADAAEFFFKAAEESLDVVVNRTPDTAAANKAQFLGKLSLIRGRYLNKAAQAKTDIELAIALQPENKSLQRSRAMLAKTNAEHFKGQLQIVGGTSHE